MMNDSFKQNSQYKRCDKKNFCQNVYMRTLPNIIKERIFLYIKLYKQNVSRKAF